jgi:hypothetical protein
MIRKDVIFAILTTFCMCTLMFAVIPIRSGQPYDPWADINDDGTINMKDIAYVASRFGTDGRPLNKTATLSDLESRIAALEAKFPIKNIDLAPSAIAVINGGNWDWITTNASDYVDMPGMNITVDLSRRSVCLILFSVEWQCDIPSGVIDVRCLEAGWPGYYTPSVLYDDAGHSHIMNIATYDHYFLAQWEAGTHKVTMQWRVTPGATARAVYGTLTVIPFPA